MKRYVGPLVGLSLLSGTCVWAATTAADFELDAPDGRRVLLKRDGTWQYVEKPGEAKKTADGKPVEKKPEGDLALLLQTRADTTRGCRFAVQLTNEKPYEIGSLVLSYSAYRANGVVYDTVAPASGFLRVKPGDKQARQFEFHGLACRDIARVQVVGGDRCEMGDLHKWSDQDEHKGQCLARVRVLESALVRFDK